MTDALEPRPELRDLQPTPHGALVPRELEAAGLDPAQVLDFSTNVNPFGPPPAVREALADMHLARYPDRYADKLTDAIAWHSGSPPHTILVGNGASELIWLIALAYADRGRQAGVFVPTYGEYSYACRLMGAEVVELRAEADNQYAFSAVLVGALKELQPQLVFICNPNNPTGHQLSLDSLAHLRAAAPDALWVIDEAYRAFAPSTESAAEWLLEHDDQRLLILRSLTKDHALAGLRLGYVLGHADTLAPLRAAQPPWSVSTAAQVAGVAALDDSEYVTATIARVRQAGEKLWADLRSLGLTVLPTDTHYALVEVGDGANMRRQLLALGIQVRDCAPFGLPGHIRIAAHQPADNARLIDALRKLLQGSDL